jgi:hypothetical protein
MRILARKALLLAPLGAIVSLLRPALVSAQACAMCGSAFTADDPLSRAFSWSILFLMAAPYAIVGTAGGLLFYLYHRAPGRRRGTVIDLARTGRHRPLRGAESGGELS